MSELTIVDKKGKPLSDPLNIMALRNMVNQRGVEILTKTYKDRKSLRLTQAFDWEKSHEGDDFWEKVCMGYIPKRPFRVSITQDTFAYSAEEAANNLLGDIRNKNVEWSIKVQDALNQTLCITTEGK